MLDNLTTAEKVGVGAVAIGITALILHKPTRKAVGLADRSRTKKTRNLKINRKTKDSKPYRHIYMMLGRLQSDNEYYLGNGNRYEKHLWAGNVKDQIAEMKKLYNELPKHLKPEWLSMTDINNYEKKMK
jgi:hypothetical protein